MRYNPRKFFVSGTADDGDGVGVGTGEGDNEVGPAFESGLLLYGMYWYPEIGFFSQVPGVVITIFEVIIRRIHTIAVGTPETHS